MNPLNDFDQNVINKLKEYTKLQLITQEKIKLSLIALKSIKINFKNYEIYSQFYKSTENKTENKFEYNLVEHFVFSQNLWKIYYDKLCDNIYKTDNIIKTYNITMTQTINKMINNQQITYENSSIIILKNPSLQFISFTQSNDFLHNLVRNYFIPLNGYLLVYNTELIRKQINNYKLNDIIEIYSDKSHNEISIKIY